MDAQQAKSPTNDYVINVEGANNRRRMFNASSFISTTNILQRKGSDAIDSFSQDLHGYDQVFSNQCLKNKEVDYSERQEKANSKLELAMDEQQSRNLDITSTDQLKRNSKVSEIVRTKSKKEINYNDIQQIIKSNQKKGNQYIQQKIKTINDQQQNKDQQLLNIGNGVTEDYFQYENNHADEFVNSKQNEEGQEAIKLRNQIVIFSYLLQFVKSLLVRYMYKKHNMLSVLQYRIIGDNAIIIQKNQRKRIDEIQKVKHRNIFERINFIREINVSSYNLSNFHKESIMKKFIFSIVIRTRKILKQILKRVIIFKPNNPFILIWEIAFLLVILFFLLAIPIEWSFDLTDSQKKVLKIMNYFQVGVFVADIFIGFHTGFYEFGEIVMVRMRIYEKYFKEKFKTNFISLSLLAINFIIDFKLLNFLALLIMVNSITEKIERTNLNLQLYQKLSSLQELIKLFCFIFLSIHIFGCGFHFVAIYSEWQGIQNNWLRQNDLLNTSAGEQYINSIYFTMISMCTIGYGDIHPLNYYEKIYVLGMAFISCGLFAFSVNLIGSIIQDIQKKTKDFRNKQSLISSYMNERQVQLSTQMRVLKYLEFIEDFQDSNITEGAKILETCSQEIKEELLKEYFGRILKTIKLIKGTFSQEFLIQLSLVMRERRFAPGEILVQKGQQMKHLFFITKGQTEYFIANNGNFLNLCDYDEKMIDLKCFITQQPSEISVRSKGITTAAYIDFHQWEEIIKQFGQDREKACCLRDQFLNDKRYQYPCKSCGQFQHNLYSCPQVCYKINKSLYFNKLVLNIQQDRTKTNRRDKKKQISSYTSNETIRQGLKLIRWGLVKEIYEDYEETDVQQECTMIEKDKEFYLRCPKIKLSYFLKKDEQKDEVQYNYPQVKVKGFKQQKSESNFFFNQFNQKQELSSSSSSSFMTTSESEDSSDSSDIQNTPQQPQVQQQQQQYEQAVNSLNSNQLSTNLMPSQIPLDSKFDYSEIHIDFVNNQNYYKKNQNESGFQQYYLQPRRSKSNTKTPKNSRIENFEQTSQNIQNSPNPIYFDQVSQKQPEDNIQPQQNNYPLQQHTILEKIHQQRRSILSNNQSNLREKYISLMQLQYMQQQQQLIQSQLQHFNQQQQNQQLNQQNQQQINQQQQLPSQMNYNQLNSPSEKNNINSFKFTFENSKSFHDEEPQILSASQINSSNNIALQQQQQQNQPHQQANQLNEQNSGTPVVSMLNSIISQMQNQIEKFYFQVSSMQQLTNQQFQAQAANKKKKKAMRFNLPSNQTPNNKQSQQEVSKENNRQQSITSSHNGFKDSQKDNLKMDISLDNKIQNFHLFGKCEFFFDIAKEFMYYYPKYNQSSIIKAYKKYQSLIIYQLKDQYMTKKATSLKMTMHQSIRKKLYPKKTTQGPLKRNNMVSFNHS
ncbi:cyclic nucleotide-binding domain protein (macronuclear) [Tetrahymena thermophila SB210]|uniref:Cyclic nucleotide-binding domain protein n=1 Tax=Tetrahymena thermophila (strain SB210) TaxID=312017 RepID=Q22B64_TETTS|nr:cyclic nucleotide-binding domain protein [Tetrahymena thermophila SB210]EAR82537.2 cyclic nucleotide-binding domain protein [Tetrahymena thermophila SB210]|eukprot:XP_001030200.2 cyclic nucleotide-binding domain protein [Tetrahymena thermophila SB210]